MELFKWILKGLRRGENLDTLITITLAFIVAIYSYLGNVETQRLASLTLTVLALLVTSNLVNRYRFEKDLEKLTIPDTPLLGSRKDLAKLTEYAKEAKDILIIASSASGVLLDTQFFVDKIQQRTKIRLAILSLDDAAVIDVLGRSDIIPADRQRTDMITARGLIKRIQSKIRASALFEVRFFDYVSTLSFVMIDANLPTGRIIVEMYPFQIDPGLRPHFIVSAREHNEWFNYFRNICEDIWRNAKRSERQS